jgi:hypothetical protein
MIFESEDEKKAFDFVCYLADEETSRHGCNDLEPEQLKVFSNILVDAQDVNCTKFQKFATMDFEIIYWLKKQVKGVEKVKALIYVPTEEEKKRMQEYMNQTINMLSKEQLGFKAYFLNCLIGGFEDAYNIQFSKLMETKK